MSIENNYSDIPADILNYHGGAAGIPPLAGGPEFKEAIKKTNFLIRINPNISSKAHSLEQDVALTRKLRAVNDSLISNTQTGALLKPQFREAKILEVVGPHVERGSKQQMIHSHVIVKFDKYVHYDIRKVNALIKRSFPKASLDIRNYQDVDSIMRKYIAKGQSGIPRALKGLKYRPQMRVDGTVAMPEMKVQIID